MTNPMRTIKLEGTTYSVHYDPKTKETRYTTISEEAQKPKSFNQVCEQFAKRPESKFDAVKEMSQDLLRKTRALMPKEKEAPDFTPTPSAFKNACNKVITFIKDIIAPEAPSRANLPVRALKSAALSFIESKFDDVKARYKRHNPYATDEQLNKATYQKLGREYNPDGQFSPAKSTQFMMAQDLHAAQQRAIAAEQTPAPIAEEVPVAIVAEPVAEKPQTARQFIEERYESKRAELKTTRGVWQPLKLHQATRNALFKEYKAAHPELDDSTAKQRFVRAFHAYDTSRI